MELGRSKELETKTFLVSYPLDRYELTTENNVRRHKTCYVHHFATLITPDKNISEVKGWMDFWKPKISEQDRIYAKHAHSWGNQVSTESKQMIRKFSGKPCVSPFSTVVLHVNGKVPLCGADYNCKHVMGNFYQQSIEEIWNDDSFSDIRSLRTNKRRNEIEMCRSCHIWEKEYTVNAVMGNT